MTGRTCVMPLRDEAAGYRCVTGRLAPAQCSANPREAVSVQRSEKVCVTWDRTYRDDFLHRSARRRDVRACRRDERRWALRPFARKLAENRRTHREMRMDSLDRLNESRRDAVTTWPSGVGFDATLARLRDALAERGLRIFAEIDQAAAAADAGMTMPPTVLILFGNPTAGTPVMLREPRAAVELPLKLVVRQTADGRVEVDYLDAARVLEHGYGIDDTALLAPLARVPALLQAAITA
ncbi:DUF302 domain-containing protein [Burkholderia sp. 22PA0099]|uniref:DUF302 domain-containing protein n=1 Tax=Burkholderia sp. 22PA0099 TaxID=3237372 RepID=UPI0039C046B2